MSGVGNHLGTDRPLPDHSYRLIPVRNRPHVNFKQNPDTKPQYPFGLFLSSHLDFHHQTPGPLFWPDPVGRRSVSQHPLLT